MDFFQPWHLIIIAVLLLVLFGAKRLPELGKGLGEGLKGFKEGMKGVADPTPVASAQTAVAPPQSTSAPSKSSYRCPNCKSLVAASAPNPGATEDFGFCPECGQKFNKKTSLA